MSLMDILVDYARPPILCAGAVAVAVTVALLRRTSCLAALTVLPVFLLWHAAIITQRLMRWRYRSEYTALSLKPRRQRRP